MAYTEFVYKNWVDKKEPLANFPFDFDAKKLADTPEHDFELDTILPTDDYDDLEIKNKKAKEANEKLKQDVKEALINVVDFNKISIKDKTYIAKLNIYKLDGKKRELIETRYLEIYIKDTGYKYILINSVEQLKKILSVPFKKIAFDTETTGLDPEADHIVGVSFSFGNKTGYYFAVAHAEQFKEYNLGLESLKIFYEAMTKAERVYMFNSRFDMRMMEYTDDSFDMSKVKTHDVQVSAWFADPDFRQHSLKYLEKHFLGYYRPDLSDTLKSNKLKNFDLSIISPKNILFYAAQDALSTYDLGEETYKYHEEFRKSGIIDQTLLYPLMKMENHSMRIDTLYLEEQLAHIMPRLEELNEKLHNEVGNVNFNSPKQKQELFKSFGLHTNVETKTGAMATGTKEVEEMIENLEAKGKSYPSWLKYLGERAKLEKLQSTFFNSLLQQAKLNNGRVRINYRNTQAATGRMSSGADRGE